MKGRKDVNEVRERQILREMPKVSFIQWALTSLSLLLAASSYYLTAYEDLATLALVLTLLSAVLFVQVAIEAVNTRLPGK